MIGLYCPRCEHAVEEIFVEVPASEPYGEPHSYADFAPKETYFLCGECGCTDVDYTDLCDVCGSGDRVFRAENHDICDECLAHLAENGERFEDFLRATDRLADFYCGYIYDQDAPDKLASDIVDIVRRYVRESFTICDIADAAKEYLLECAADDAASYLKGEIYVKAV